MNYYDMNASQFFNDTVNADMSPHYREFLRYLPQNAHILDAGCGSGRDTLMFKSLGYKVTAIDGSLEMCRMASDHAGQEVLHMRFQDIDFDEIFDGIWASASLLHVSSSEIEYVLDKLKGSLKEDGVIYASFKYGDFEGERNGRYFNDLTESSVSQLFSKFNILKIWITFDSRPGREDEKWVNIIAKKQSF